MHKVMALGLATLLTLGGLGCSPDGLLNTAELPPDVSDPAITQTPDGARRAYNGTLGQLRTVFSDFAATTGLLSDERVGRTGANLDRREMPEGNESEMTPYGTLQKVRNQGRQAAGLLSRYLADEPAFQAHMFAVQGYAEVFLAELFCSGIPLSTLDYDGDYTYQAGSSTEDVFKHATSLFDTALSLAGGSVQIRSFAGVGKARALLALGRYADAAAAVDDIADDYRYDVSYTGAVDAVQGAIYSNFGRFSATSSWAYTIPDVEGTNGLNWRTSEDPRTPVTAWAGGVFSPSNFDTLGGNAFVLASGTEARLIEAEAALRADDVVTWLATLNALRTDGTYEVNGSDILWHAGGGGVAGLDSLRDPGAALSGAAADSARVDLLFRERGFWLFLTGHRQGDLRRLIRQYGRREHDVYPIGTYPSTTGTSYGPDVTVPIPQAESNNPLFTGCFSRSA